MNVKSLFGYAVAVSLLATGFASCTPEDQKDDPTPDRPTVTVRYSVEVTETTQNSVKAEVTTTGADTDTWYAFVTTDLDTRVDQIIEATVARLDDIESVLKSGDAEVEFTDLDAGTSYRIIVTGLAADGTVSGKSDEAEFKTKRDPNAWSKNPDWTVEYVGRDSYETSSGSTVYGDLINVTVSNDNTDYYYIDAVSKSDFETLYNGNISEYAKSTVEYLNALIEENNEQYPDYPVSITDISYYGSRSIIMQPLTDEEQYVVLVGIEPTGITGEGSGLYAMSDAFTPQVEEASDAYNKWIGTWTVSGYSDAAGTTPCTNTIKIEQNIPNYDYVIYGWQEDLMLNGDGTYITGSPATFDEGSGSLYFDSSSNLGKLDTGTYGIGTLEFLGYAEGTDFGYPGENVSIGGDYTIAIASMDQEGNVTVVPQTIPLMSGESVTLAGMEFYASVTGGRLYWDAPSPRFDVGEFTMTKSEGTSSSSASSVSARSLVRKTAKAVEARTYLPMSLTYKVR